MPINIIMSIEDSIRQTVQEQVESVTKSKFSRINSETYSLQARIDFLESKLEETLLLLKDRNRDFGPGEISGDKIAGGKIVDFQSQGIKDEANQTILKIKDDKVEVDTTLEVNGELKCKMLYYYNARTDNLDVKNSVMIDHNEVLWKDRLGNSVTKSKLQEVGVLKELNVADTLQVFKNKVGVGLFEPVGPFGVAKEGIEISVNVKGDTGFVGTVDSTPFSIGVSNEPTLYVSHDNKIGIKVKKPKADLDVAGYIRYQGQTQQYLEHSPANGTWSQGDIVWNTQPQKGSVLGWVCVKAGAPGTWRPFVSID
jgi:hypothetical protein